MSDNLADTDTVTSAAGQRREQRRAIGRDLFVRTHRYIGLSLGALFVLIGLTGSILAFWQWIDEQLNADLTLVKIPEQAIYRSPGEIVAGARGLTPPGAELLRLRMPRHAAAAARVYYETRRGDRESDRYEVSVNPYTAEPTGQRIAMRGNDLLSQSFIHIVMDLHWTLLFGYDRAYVVGVPAIFLLVSTLVGLYLWWPRNGAWRQALTIKKGASAERVTLDIHKTIGLYLSPALIFMMCSGIYLIFEPQVKSVVALLSPVRETPKDLKSAPTSERPPLGADAVAAIADRVFPDGTLHSISFPKGPDGVFVVGKRADDEPNHADTSRNVTIDQYSGRILHVQDRTGFTAGERFLEWQYPLHSGEAFGNAGRAFILSLGFVPLILYVTGFLRWRHKRRARSSGGRAGESSLGGR